MDQSPYGLSFINAKTKDITFKALFFSLTSSRLDILVNHESS